MRRVIAIQAAAAAVVMLLPAVTHAQLRAQLVASGFSSPLHFVQDPKILDVVYIVEQGGLVQTLFRGQRVDPFIDLRNVISTGGERGLLGMAFDPNVATDRVYLNFTDVNGNTVIARFKRRGAIGPMPADPASRFDLRWPTGERFIRQPFANHNGGNLVFGPDGYLYVGLGDGGSGNDPENHAQNPFSLLGKMLRIDVNVSDGDPNGYRVPFDNPFLDSQPIAALAEIWDFGLRNPWRYTFDDVGAGATRALIIADVGQNQREEINYEPAGHGGRNYGWRIREGRIATPGVPATSPAYGPLTDPLFDYGRSTGQAITGGYVYRGTALGPSYFGRYFFADFVASRVWSMGLTLNPVTGEATMNDFVEHTSELGGNLGGIASFGRDFAGELYLLTFSGRVVKIVHSDPTNPPLGLSSLVIQSTVTLSWTAPAGGVTPTAYQVEAGSVPGAANLAVFVSAGASTSATFQNVPDGTYYVRVRALGSGGTSGASNEIVVNVGAFCVFPPTAATLRPAVVAGRTVTLSWQQLGALKDPWWFEFEVGSASGAADLLRFTVDASQSSLTAQAPPGIYFVRIRGVNGCGVGAASNEVVVTVF